MSTFNTDSYGPAFAPFLGIDRRRPLDVGKPDTETRAGLKNLSIDSAFAHAQPIDTEMAACCIASVWLLYDCLDESHTISQGIDTPSGSFWHAIMHRREGDFSNAKYWFRHVGQHPVYSEINQQAHVAASLRDADLRFGKTLIPDGDWDPYAFVDLCQSVARGQTAARALCLDIQQAEWELLFDHCYRQATGK